MQKAKLIGIKHVSGTSKKTGQPFSFTTACLTTDMSERDVKNGAIGLDVHTPVIPDSFADVLNERNIGKDFEVSFYFANNRTNIGYAALAGK